MRSQSSVLRGSIAPRRDCPRVVACLRDGNLQHGDYVCLSESRSARPAQPPKEATMPAPKCCFDRILPRTRTNLAAMQSGADSVLAMPDALFG